MFQCGYMQVYTEKVGSGKERGILPLSIGMLSSGTTCGHTALLKLPPLSHSEADSGLLSWVNREVRPAGLQPAKQSAKGRGGDATYRGRRFSVGAVGLTQPPKKPAREPGGLWLRHPSKINRSP